MCKQEGKKKIAKNVARGGQKREGRNSKNLSVYTLKWRQREKKKTIRGVKEQTREGTEDERRREDERESAARKDGVQEEAVGGDVAEVRRPENTQTKGSFMGGGRGGGGQNGGMKAGGRQHGGM